MSPARAVLSLLVLTLGIELVAQPVQVPPYESLARTFVAAVQREAYPEALKLRSKNYHAPLQPVSTAMSDRCTASVEAIATVVVATSETHADILATIPFDCLGEKTPVQRQRLVRVIREDGEWKVALNRSVERQLALELLAAPADQRRRVFREFSPPTVVAVAEALLEAVDEWMGEGRMSDAESALALLDGNCDLLDERLLARCAVEQGRLLRQRGDFDAARESIQQSMIACNAAGDAECAALAHNELGLIYVYQARFDLAETEMKESLRLRNEIGDQLGVANILSGLGIVSTRHGDFASAEQYYSRSAKLRHQIGDTVGSARVLNNYGLLFNAKDDVESALIYLNHSAKLFERVGNRQRQAAALMNIGVIYRYQNNYRLALDIALQSYEVFCAVDDKYNGAIALREIGADYAGLGDWVPAIRYLGQAIELSQGTGFTENRTHALREMGNAYAIAGRHEDALRCLLDAYPDTSRDMAPAVLARIGAELAATGRIELALDYAERAGAMAKAMGKPRDLATARTVSGEAHTFLGEFDRAETSYREAIDAIEKVRSMAAGNERAQAHFMDRKLSAYHGIAQLLISQGKDDEALRYAEQAKSRVLVDVLNGGRTRLAKALTGDQKATEQQLREALALANLALAEAVQAPSADGPAIAQLQQEVEKARLAYEQFEARLFLDSPRTKLQRGALDDPTSEIVASIVHDEATAIVEYVFTRDSVLAFVVRRVGGEVRVTSRVLPMMSDSLGAVTNAFVAAVAVKDLRFANGSRSLYDAVFAPIANDVAGATQLVIIPDGPLWSLPFEALRGEDGKYVIERAAISYAPSIAAYAEMIRARATRERKVMPRILALGNPRMDVIASVPAQQTEPRQTRAALRADKFAPLPESEDEVRRIASLYGEESSRIYIGADASEQRVKDEAGAYDVVHLATHAVADAENPMYSYLMLSRGGAAGDDGRLEAWEIANLNLRAELVVLSACETARGQYLDGEGIIGLSWAWFLAGTPAAVLSRWKVDSAATAELMVAFHENRGRDGVGDAEALRQAAIAMMRDKRYRHPFYWASFQVIGAARR